MAQLNPMGLWSVYTRRVSEHPLPWQPMGRSSQAGNPECCLALLSSHPSITLYHLNGARNLTCQLACSAGTTMLKLLSRWSVHPLVQGLFCQRFICMAWCNVLYQNGIFFFFWSPEFYISCARQDKMWLREEFKFSEDILRTYCFLCVFFFIFFLNTLTESSNTFLSKIPYKV